MQTSPYLLYHPISALRCVFLFQLIAIQAEVAREVDCKYRSAADFIGFHATPAHFAAPWGIQEGLLKEHHVFSQC